MRNLTFFFPSFSDGLEVGALLEDHNQIRNIKLECLDDVLPEPVCEIGDSTADAAGKIFLMLQNW